VKSTLAGELKDSEPITESCPRPNDPVESFAEPHHTFGPDGHSTRDVPLDTDPPVKEPDRFGSVDPKPRIVGIGVRPLQACAAAGDEVGVAVRCGPEQQTPSERGLREVVMVAAEDVADAGGVDITLDHKTRRQLKADGAAEYRRVPLLRISVAERGAPDRADDDGPVLLSPDGCSEQADNQS